MAPNRKKKKPAGNPARGFATTSIVSKSKIDDDTPAIEVTDEADNDYITQTSSAVPTTITNGQRVEKELRELTPEQLELQLEESELQLLVEKHAEKSKKETSRQVSRLQTERRLLRMQAIPLYTSRWLPEELLQLIYDYIARDIPSSSLATQTTNSQKKSGVFTDNLSIRLWTLKRTLVDLGFLPSRVDEAIAHLIQAEQSMEQANMLSGREGIWGLDECLDWLALTCTREEMPDYDSHRTEAIEKSIRESARPPVALEYSKLHSLGSLKSEGSCKTLEHAFMWLW